MKKEERIVQLETEAAALKDQLLRALADCQNIKKRTAAQLLEVTGRANQELISKLLPVIDNLERAALHQKDDGHTNILKQFHLILAGEGVSVIESDGVDFDPHTMECVEVVPGPKDLVVKTTSKGYLYGENVLRPARVVVGSGVSLKGGKTSSKD